MTGVFRYALKRVFLVALTMVLVSFLTYLAFELVSGDPARTMLGTEATEAQVTAPLPGEVIAISCLDAVPVIASVPAERVGSDRLKA